MKSRWGISIEDLVYLVISAGLICLFIAWIISTLPSSDKSYNSKSFDTPSISKTTESLAQKGVKKYSPPTVSRQVIHPLKVIRTQRNPDPLPSQLPPPKDIVLKEIVITAEVQWSLLTDRAILDCGRMVTKSQDCRWELFGENKPTDAAHNIIWQLEKSY